MFKTLVRSSKELNKNRTRFLHNRTFRKPPTWTFNTKSLRPLVFASKFSDFKRVDENEKTTKEDLGELEPGVKIGKKKGKKDLISEDIQSDPELIKLQEKMSSELPKDESIEQMMNELREEQSKTEAKSTEEEEKEKDILIPETELIKGEATTQSFQAETSKILDIVARSLYSEREIFIRELISNASDALEKLRQKMQLGEDIEDEHQPLEVNIAVDEKNNTFTIQDSGIGMTKQELMDNLGKIGHSGTEQFLKLMESKDRSSTNLIGQFGVGFYSSFMVGEEVRVYSKSAKVGSRGYAWRSDGSGVYSIAEADGVSRGTKIVIKLRDNSVEFAKKQTVDNAIKKYSNFVGFTINLNGHPVNTIRALWLEKKDNITEDQHKEFYQFISHAFDSPTYILHYSADGPISIRSLLYFPETHMEKYGMGRIDPGVSLFSRKVLIQSKCKGLIPDWLRFIKGVVDSEDVSLNLSREFLQDSALVKRLSSVLTRRVLKFLKDEAKSDPDKYNKWFKEFGSFLKEGICTDYKWKEDIAALLRLESSKTPAGELTSLDDYISRMKETQKEIYFLVIASREFAETSPYFEAFKAKDIEVLFLYATVDDFVMSNLGEYQSKKLSTIESASAAESIEATQEPTPPSDVENAEMSEQEFQDFANWMKETLSERVTTITKTSRLSTSPAIVIDHESASFRRMMKFVDPSRAPKLPKQQIQVNPKHPIILLLNKSRKENPDLAKDVAEQVVDNALIQAGLLDDSRSMIPRLNKLLEKALGS
eukprot:TRINITY_DN4479_c0_g1_i1.p1 TRINITY_DN4479_c0_g1~~TRINITY_DN4479_c0_g1_i1.p1  ORF type:complete len:767 (-),score=205.53 TRINITY_DN4479_c0_g1_i1:16-2316(-)